MLQCQAGRWAVQRKARGLAPTVISKLLVVVIVTRRKAKGAKNLFMEIMDALYCLMARTRRHNFDRLLNFLISMPWWISAALGSIGLVFWGVAMADRPGYPLGGLPGVFLLLVLLFFGGTALGSVIQARRQHVALRHKSSLQALRAVPWQEFERLVGAYYRERGFGVVHTGQPGPDGGIDLVLRKDSERILVQCKRYRDEPVKVEAIREFFGVVVSEGAHRGIFVTTSDFTAPAMEFGLRHAMLELIPGLRFAQMVGHLREPASTAPSHPKASLHGKSPVPCCPLCAAVMISRVARRGPGNGQSFWGCPRFPACTGRRAMKTLSTCDSAT
jgi:restriction system protein